MADRIVVVVGVESDGGRVLVQQRTAKREFPLCWEFPGGKVEPGECEPEALIREWTEELGVTPQITGWLGCWRFEPPVMQRPVIVSAYKVSIGAQAARSTEGCEVRYLFDHEVRKLPGTPTTPLILDALEVWWAS